MQILSLVTPRTKAIVLNSPSNPTGRLCCRRRWSPRIADHCAATGIWLVVDLCYERLIYEDVPHNLVKVITDRHRERSVLCGSASKAYAMTGWRCGWAIAPAPVIAACNTVQGHSTSNVSSIAQKAAAAALTGPQDAVAAMLQRVPGPPRPDARLAHDRSADRVPDARRGVLPLSRTSPSCWRRAASPPRPRSPSSC